MSKIFFSLIPFSLLFNYRFAWLVDMKIWYVCLHNRLTLGHFSFETLQPTVCKLAVMHVINNNIPRAQKGPNRENRRAWENSCGELTFVSNEYSRSVILLNLPIFSNKYLIQDKFYTNERELQFPLYQSYILCALQWILHK